MITLSAFADEIGPDLSLQLDVLARHGIARLDVRGIGGRNVSTFTPAQVKEYRRQMAGRGFSVACIGSPIGKIRLDENFDAHLDLLRTCSDVAHGLDTRYVRVFSFYASQGRQIADQRQEVMDRFADMLEVARSQEVVLLHENEHAIFGQGPEAVKDLMAAFRGPHLGSIFDPANFCTDGMKPYDDCWRQGLDALTDYFHIKDYRAGEKACCPAGQGDGQFDELLADLKGRNWAGVMAIEPHMAAMGQFSGFSGPELFGKAVEGIQGMLSKHGLEYC